MDFASVIASINYWAVLVAAVASFAIGGVWYSALFSRPHMKAAGMSPELAQGGNVPMIFTTAFVLQLIAAFVLAMFLGPKADLAFGIAAGLMVGVAWVATALGVIYLFERRNLPHFAINASYQIVTYTVMGAILGAWH